MAEQHYPYCFYFCSSPKSRTESFILLEVWQDPEYPELAAKITFDPTWELTGRTQIFDFMGDRAPQTYAAFAAKTIDEKCPILVYTPTGFQHLRIFTLHSSIRRTDSSGKKKRSTSTAATTHTSSRSDLAESLRKLTQDFIIAQARRCHEKWRGEVQFSINESLPPGLELSSNDLTYLFKYWLKFLTTHLQLGDEFKTSGQLLQAFLREAPKASKAHRFKIKHLSRRPKSTPNHLLAEFDHGKLCRLGQKHGRDYRTSTALLSQELPPSWRDLKYLTFWSVPPENCYDLYLGKRNKNINSDMMQLGYEYIDSNMKFLKCSLLQKDMKENEQCQKRLLVRLMETIRRTIITTGAKKL